MFGPHTLALKLKLGPGSGLAEIIVRVSPFLVGLKPQVCSGRFLWAPDEKARMKIMAMATEATLVFSPRKTKNVLQ